jgi:hypothetical protein
MATKPCKHKFTGIAPQAGCEYDVVEGEPIWEWCIRCGCLRLGRQIFRPGPKQKMTILSCKE